MGDSSDQGARGTLPRCVVTAGMETRRHSGVFSSAWEQAQSRWGSGVPGVRVSRRWGERASRSAGTQL